MPKSMLAQTLTDVQTVAVALVNKAKEARSMITIRLDTFGFESDHVLIVAPDADSERISWEIIAVLTS